MKNLIHAEERIMLVVWKRKKAFVCDIIEQMSEPKPPYTTVSTIIRVLRKKEVSQKYECIINSIKNEKFYIFKNEPQHVMRNN